MIEAIDIKTAVELVGEPDRAAHLNLLIDRIPYLYALPDERRDKLLYEFSYSQQFQRTHHQFFTSLGDG